MAHRKAPSYPTKLANSQKSINLMELKHIAEAPTIQLLHIHQPFKIPKKKIKNSKINTHQKINRSCLSIPQIRKSTRKDAAFQSLSSNQQIKVPNLNLKLTTQKAVDWQIELE